MLSLRCSLPGRQSFDSLGLQLGLLEHGLRLGERGLGGPELHFEPDWVDSIEHLAGFDLGALLERTLQHDSRDARAYFRDPRRGDPARKLADVGPR